uniref:Uncharacterized protein n=1 Tax=Candidatus Kentrum sp. TC TaxID=2126339 RepID=A0A450Y8M9_9GAMM|nr:MAG: hypothetical protein BECKTC1821E_GA0114239_1001138 [Candidatus Kentron sp. TC]
MPFPINLTVQERRRTFKAGPDSVSFIQNALAATEDQPDILPASFSIPEFKNDANFFAALTDIGMIAASVASQIDDTRLAVGNEAMRETAPSLQLRENGCQNHARSQTGGRSVGGTLQEGGDTQKTGRTRANSRFRDRMRAGKDI